ncbi:hypothetical protein BGZ75_006129, partial [Mortierella antarctica]
EQAGHPIVEYSRFKDEETWKAKFLSREDESRLLREACPLVRSGNQYRFVHKSLLEYCFTRAVFDPQASSPTILGTSAARRGSVSSMFSFEGQTAPEGCDIIKRQTMLNCPLGWRSFVDEPSILQFLAERVQQEPSFKQQLLMMIEHSKADKDGRIAASNAITILVRAGIQFIVTDSRGIQVPGADLSYGIFEEAQLQGADVRKANFHNIWPRQADLSDSKMSGVRFGEWPYLQEDSGLWCLAYSPDGKSLAAGFEDHSIIVYETMTWTKLNTIRGHRDIVYAVAYSPAGHRIASGSWDRTVRLWDPQTGAGVLTIDSQSQAVTAVVFSPSGHQIASGSFDNIVQLRDAQTGTLELTLTGHTEAVMSVAYSPSGHQIASASMDKTVQLWDAQSGVSKAVLTEHTEGVESVAFSPNGHQLASCACDRAVRLWNAQTGASLSVMRGHSDIVTNVTFSPSGHQIASGSTDKTVRIWDVESGTCSLILAGHTAEVWTVAYSSTGHRIASCSEDGTVRLWDVISGECLTTMNDVDSLINWLVWRESDAGSYLAPCNRENAVRMCWVTEEEGKPCSSLQWSSPHGSLYVKDANIQNVHGLNRMQIQLLKQRDVVGVPTSPISIRTVGKKVITMTAVKWFSKVPKAKLLDDLAKDPFAGEAEPEVPRKGGELAVVE